MRYKHIYFTNLNSKQKGRNKKKEKKKKKEILSSASFHDVCYILYPSKEMTNSQACNKFIYYQKGGVPLKISLNFDRMFDWDEKQENRKWDG